MSGTLASCVMALSLVSLGGLPEPPPSGPPLHYHTNTGGRILPNGPGYGWGFPNGNPDGYGYVDYGTDLPLGANRTAEYYFPRYFAVPAVQAFFPTYYNPYFTRGQRYVPYAGAGGEHP